MSVPAIEEHVTGDAPGAGGLMKRRAGEGRTATDWISDRGLRAALRLARALPYGARVRLFGWLMRAVIGPIAGFPKRVATNLAHTCPDLPKAEARRIARGVLDNAGRTMIEIYSGQDFIDRVRDLPLQGGGAAVLEACHAEGKPVVLVTGHFGNYDASRAALIARGFHIGALYRPMNNGYFNTHYVKAISTIGEPVFARGRKGYAKLLRFLKDGGMAAFLIDQYAANGETLTFFGQPAPTALSAAELALRYDAPLIASYGVRRENGLDFDIIVEPPIPPSDPATMTQALNDSLERLTRQHMEQWFWIHRRWKPHRQRNRAAARTGPKPDV